jgi:adenine-specific DNA-methyltransferase
MYTHFSPEGLERRQYLSPENALRIDRVRQTLELWYERNLISEKEKHYLLCSLIEVVPSVSNTTGTYGAYLKHWDKRALKPIALTHLAIEPTKENNEIFNSDANDLIHKISGDVLYIDTPYNGRQYSKNYHLLETLARYDNPDIRGVTGLRVDSSGDSQYCKRASVYEAFDSLIGSASFKTVILSYSNDGLLSEEQLIEILTRYGRASSLQLKKIPYRRYKRTSNDQRNVLEYLIAVNK